jgi:hypothetical protein
MTSASLRIAYDSACARRLVEVVVPVNALTGMIFAFHATPAMPRALLPTAAMVPATCVPWPTGSVGSLSPSPKSQPRTSSTKPLPSSSTPLPAISPGLTQTFAARSGCVWSTPLSTTATTTPAPWVCSQICGRPISATGHMS